MTEGLFVSKNKKYISQINQNTYTLNLLAAGGSVDVFTYDIRVDKPCNIYPSDKPGLMEFYYVLDGAAILKLADGDIVLEKGEHFYAYSLKENINFTTRNGAKLLCVTSQPVFNALSEYHEELCKLLDTVESKDLYTYHHGYRVQMYSQKIADKIKLGEESMYTLQVASLFHDIGKFYVPDDLLKKTDALTKEEYDCIKKHPAVSRALLKERFAERILQAVEQHHERLDGSGYPKGLTDSQILPEAKIIAVADTYDAITSDRAYRKSSSPKCAMKELERLTGCHYDESLVKALRNVLVEDGTLL
jgi:putative nucleotidyltransferase with HDIG domain